MTGWRNPKRPVAAAVIAAMLLAAGGCTRANADGDAEARAEDGTGHQLAQRLGDVTEAAVDVVSGADSVAIRADDLAGDLYQISTPDDARVRPRVVTTGGVIQVHLVDATDVDSESDVDSDSGEGDSARRETGTANDNDTGENRDGDDGGAIDRRITGRTKHDGPAVLELRLNSTVRWTLRLNGGAKLTTLDMARGRLQAVDLAAGVNRIEVTLPRPEGTVAVRMRGGASVFNVRLPADVPARVRVGGGAGEVTIGSQTRSGVSGGTVFAPAGWDGATDRYDVDAVAGVASLSVTAG